QRGAVEPAAHLQDQHRARLQRLVDDEADAVGRHVLNQGEVILEGRPDSEADDLAVPAAVALLGAGLDPGAAGRGGGLFRGLGHATASEARDGRSRAQAYVTAEGVSIAAEVRSSVSSRPSPAMGKGR